MAQASGSTRQTLVACLLLLAFCISAPAQRVVDRTIAVVRDATRAELITYSDLMWYLALQPGVPIDPPRADDLNLALQGLRDQRLFALEAKRLPRPAPTDKEFADYLNGIVARFPSPAAFEARLRQVGFSSIKDEAFERILTERLAIEKYVEFRFGSFVVVTPDEQLDYYRNVDVPEMRRRAPGVLIPPFEERRAYIDAQLRERKKLEQIENFLDQAKLRTETEYLAKPEPLP